MQRNKIVKVILVYFNPNLIDHSAALRDLVPFVHLKNVKNTRGGVLLLVKLLASSS